MTPRRPTTTFPLVSPVIPSSSGHLSASTPPRQGDGRGRNGYRRRTLPLPAIRAPRSDRMVYGMAGLDCNGRVAERTVMAALGWSSGLRVDIRIIDRGTGNAVSPARAGEPDGPAAGSVAGEVLVICPDPRGAFAVSGQGYLLVSADIRRGCGLRTADRVLLAADREHGRLVVYPPAVLDAVLGTLTGSPAADVRGIALATSVAGGDQA